MSSYSPSIVETWPLVPPPRGQYALQSLTGTGYGAPTAGSGVPDIQCQTVTCPTNAHCQQGQCLCNDSFVSHNGQCECPNGYHDDAGYCVQNAPPPPSPCPANATRSGGQCYCNVGFHEEGATCVPDQTACPPGMMFNGVTCVNAVQCPPGTIFNGVTCVEQHEQLPPQPIPSGRGTNPFLIGLGVVAVVGAIIVLSQSSS